ncbi:tubulin alpha-2/alpha-4 chain-like protein [Lates japonicus]|uniref:Tubulin alpha-2/alpha-4 chain-like protein n=1 Tax=Lates japonicus TaxID=270547 RepID=A0AAD3MAS3_LATJO|nr:tubulin alpha-2/alpha-4 chain-like protein [Lates japonicus]
MAWVSPSTLVRLVSRLAMPAGALLPLEHRINPDGQMPTDHGKEDTANNYARGHYTIGKEIIDLVLDRIRKLVADQCAGLQNSLVSTAWRWHGSGSPPADAWRRSVRATRVPDQLGAYPVSTSPGHPMPYHLSLLRKACMSSSQWLRSQSILPRPANQMVKCDRPANMACCLLFRGDVWCPKDVNAAMAPSKPKAHHPVCRTGAISGWHQLPTSTVVPGGDLAQGPEAVCMLRQHHCYCRRPGLARPQDSRSDMR